MSENFADEVDRPRALAKVQMLEQYLMEPLAKISLINCKKSTHTVAIATYLAFCALLYRELSGL
jgi:hypothetical protein